MTLSTRLRAACAVGALLALAACTSTSADGPTPTSASTTPSASVVDPSTAPPTSPGSPTASAVESSAATVSSLDPAAREAADRAAIEAQWVKFWVVYRDMIRLPEDQRADAIAAVARSPLKETMMDIAQDSVDKGIDNYGEIEHHLFWELPVDGKSVAAIGDCQDQSAAGTIELATGIKSPPGEARVSIRGQLVKDDDGAWRVQTLVDMGTNDC